MNRIFREVGPIGWNIIIGTMFGRMAISMSMPFLAIYLTKTLHASPAEAGAIVAVSALAGVFSSFIGGYLSDRFGRRNILLISVFLWASVFAGFGAAHSVIAFFIMNSLNGLCKSLFEPSSRALLSDITEPKNRLMIFNLRYTAINVGVTFGPILGLKLGSSHSTATFFAASVIYILYGISLAISLKHYVPKRRTSENRVALNEALSLIRKDKIFTLTLLAMILSIIGFSQFNSTLPQYFSESSFENGVAVFSYLLALNAVAVVLIQYPLVQLGKKLSPLVSIMAGNFVICLSLIGFGFAHNIASLIVLILLFTVGEVLMFSMTDIFIDEIADPSLKGTYFGAMGFNGLGNVLGPLLGGYLLQSFGAGKPMYLFGTLSAAAFIGVPLFFYVHLLLKRKKAHNLGDKRLHVL
ncbi:MDR family MFS transporter [Actinomycetes bacterium NPDC127524]